MAEEGTKRLGLTLDANEYARIRAYARQAGRPIATIAKRLLLAAIDDNASISAAEADGEGQERIKHLEDEVGRLQGRLQTQLASTLPADVPRWRWPLHALLGDRGWWDEWLPSLGELLGRDVAQDGGYSTADVRLAVDDRGFVDLMSHLFPTLDAAAHQQVRWYSPDYGQSAQMVGQSTHDTGAHHARQVQAEVWEPVIRHVAVALTALQATSQNPNEAYTHLRVEAEIRGEWLRTLRSMLGDDTLEQLSHLHQAVGTLGSA